MREKVRLPCSLHVEFILFSLLTMKLGASAECGRFLNRPSVSLARETRDSPDQACKLKFRFKGLTSCLSSAAASAVCVEGRLAGLEATETRNEPSQPKFEFTNLHRTDNWPSETYLFSLAAGRTGAMFAGRERWVQRPVCNLTC